MPKPVELLTTGQAAAELGVTTDTVQRWVKDATIAHIILPSGRPRIPRAEIDRILTVEGPR